MKNIPLEKSAIVVAHPDDEILWFSSIITKVDKIVICFLGSDFDSSWEEGRREALKNYPLENVTSLGITESANFDCADWQEPVLRANGIELVKKRSNIQRYEENYQILKRKLKNSLEGIKHVYTHNPWGEYGHEEHVQIHNVVTSLQDELGCDIWFSNYCSNKSLPLALKFVTGFSSDYMAIETNNKYAKIVMEIYKKNNCWTWFDDYKWFSEECFMCRKTLDRQKNVGQNQVGHIFPLNFIKIDYEVEDKPPLLQRIVNRLLGAN